MQRNDSDFLVCKENENYEHFYFGCTYSKTYWQEVKKMTTNLYIRDHVFNLETLVFCYKIYDQAYFDLNLLMTLIFLYINKAYYISNRYMYNQSKNVHNFHFLCIPESHYHFFAC
jgi:hypothetical protein